MEADEATACIEQFMARYIRGARRATRATHVEEAAVEEDVWRWTRLLHAAVLRGALRADVEVGRVVFTLGHEPQEMQKITFEFSEPAFALGAVRNIAARFAFALDEMLLGPRKISAPEPPDATRVGSPAMAAYVQSIASQVRGCALDPYGFDACVVLAIGNSKCRLHIETSNTNGRPYFVSITYLALESSSARH